MLKNFIIATLFIWKLSEDPYYWHFTGTGKIIECIVYILLFGACFTYLEALGKFMGGKD